MSIEINTSKYKYCHNAKKKGEKKTTLTFDLLDKRFSNIILEQKMLYFK